MRKQNDADYARDWRPFQAALNVLVHAASMHSLSRIRTWRPYYFLRWPLVCSAFLFCFCLLTALFLTAVVLYIYAIETLNKFASLLFINVSAIIRFILLACVVRCGHDVFVLNSRRLFSTKISTIVHYRTKRAQCRAFVLDLCPKLKTKSKRSNVCNSHLQTRGHRRGELRVG